MGIFDFFKPKENNNYFAELASITKLKKHNKEDKAFIIGGLIPEIVDFEYGLLVSTLNELINKNISFNKSVFMKEQTLLYIIFTDIVILSKLGDKLRTRYMEKIEDNYYSKMALVFRYHDNIVGELQFLLSEKERLFETCNSLNTFFNQDRQKTMSKLGLKEKNYIETSLVFNKMLQLNIESYSTYILSELV